MTILGEIRAFLDKNIREHSRGEKLRNIDLICHYYGFGQPPLPTLQQAGDDFGLSKQRVGQILQRDFRSQSPFATLPSLQKVLDTVESRAFWTASELQAESLRRGFPIGSLSLPGLLRLADDMSLPHRHDSYTPELQRVTSSGTYDSNDFFLVDQGQLDSLKAHLATARKLQGLRGIVRFEDLEMVDNFYRVNKGFAIQIIRGNPTTWTREAGGVTWYLFEEKQNALINAARKALTAFQVCDVGKLAPSIHRALKRINEDLLPPVETIEQYLRTSRLFVAQGNNLSLSRTFRPKGRAPALSPLENDAVQYLKERGETQLPEIRRFLEDKNIGRYSEAAIQKALTNSPLVFVDESYGRQNYRYSTVETQDSVRPNEPALERYLTFRNRLDELRDTDSTSEQSARTEQHILSEWLFEDKERELCALCGREFAVEALVTAHKKRREHCNEGERRDPYIVMPLCLFGCDYLYEKRHVYVAGGVVKPGAPVKADSVEMARVEDLVETQLENRWLDGPSSYFHRPTE